MRLPKFEREELLELAGLCRVVMAGPERMVLYKDAYDIYIKSDDSEWYLTLTEGRIMISKYISRPAKYLILFSELDGKITLSREYDRKTCRELLVYLRRELVLDALAGV